ncbi:MAG: hypothetical protein ACK5RL_21275, partial [Acidimicrobiales bacterium]
ERAASLTAGVAALADRVAARLGAARLIIQLDEPLLPPLVAGSDPRAGDPTTWGSLARVVTAADRAGATVVLHCCAADPPLDALIRAVPGLGAVAVDTGRIGPAGRRALSRLVRAGVEVWAGCVPTLGPVPDLDLLRADASTWPGPAAVTPACGLAGATEPGARTLTRVTVELAAALRARAGFRGVDR